MNGGPEEGWLSLDPRMLLIGPVETLRQFAVPLIIALVGVSSSRGSFQPAIAIPMVIVPVLIGFIPWLTTRYRVTDTQFQQRKGLLNKKQLTAPLDRVRSVDLEASLLHRLLGLTKVQIGTGVDDSRIELNALSVSQATELRSYLLSRRAAAVPATVSGAFDVHAQPAGPPMDPAYSGLLVVPDQVLAVIDWSWLRFAPLSLSRLALVAGAIGALTQWGDQLPFLDAQHVDSAWRWALGFAIPLLVVSMIVSAAIAWVAISVIGYVVQWWNLRLTRGPDTLHLTAGLFTTRSTTIEEARVRGVELREPVLLRLAHGAELATLATGVGSGGVTTVLPPCPVAVCQDVGHAILGVPDALLAPLVAHGVAARRRCHFRAQRLTMLVAVVASVGVYVVDASWWVPILATIGFAALGVVTANSEYRHLGHLLTTDHLAAGDGVLDRRRTVLERDGVIGWVIRQSFFQRRRGLATLLATTAAGSERVTVRDVPLHLAVSLAAQTTPHAVAPFLNSPGPPVVARP